MKGLTGVSAVAVTYAARVVGSVRDFLQEEGFAYSSAVLGVAMDLGRLGGAGAKAASQLVRETGAGIGDEFPYQGEILKATADVLDELGKEQANA